MDAEMGVILKVEDYDSQKRLKSLLMFSEINYNPEIDEATFRNRQGPGERKGPPGEPPDREDLWDYDKGKLDLEKIRKAAELDVIIPDKPPAGFVLQSVQAMNIGRRKNVHLTYTDGLNIVSVFQSPDGKSQPKEPEDRPPPWRDSKAEKLNIGGVECEVISGAGMLIYRWDQKDIQMTLMGELGQEEMTGIAGSFIGEGK